jgi:hypothetical protein
MEKNNPAQIAKSLLDPDFQEKENAKQAEKIKKQAAQNEKSKNWPKEKLWYDVKLECLLPATLTFRILAEDASQALELIKGKSPNSVQHKLAGRRDLVAKVYDAGSMMMRHMKRPLG